MRMWVLLATIGAMLGGGCLSSAQEPPAMGPMADCAYDAKPVLGNPAWTPRQGDICTDNEVTIIRLPQAQPMQREPALFVLDGDKNEVVTVRQRGRQYQVSRPIARAELRHFEGGMAEVVRIDRVSE